MADSKAQASERTKDIGDERHIRKVIYVDAETHRRLAILAAEQGRTIGEVVQMMVEESK